MSHCGGEDDPGQREQTPRARPLDEQHLDGDGGGYPAPPGWQLPRETVEERGRRWVQRPQLDRQDQAGQRPDREERDSPLAEHPAKATAVSLWRKPALPRRSKRGRQCSERRSTARARGGSALLSFLLTPDARVESETCKRHPQVNSNDEMLATPRSLACSCRDTWGDTDLR